MCVLKSILIRLCYPLANGSKYCFSCQPEFCPMPDLNFHTENTIVPTGPFASIFQRTAYLATWEAEGCIVQFYHIWDNHLPWNLKFLQVQMVVSSNTVPVLLDQTLNTSQSHIGLRKVLYYFRYDKIGLNILLLLRCGYGYVGNKG